MSQRAAIAALTGDLAAVEEMRNAFDRRRRTIVEMLVADRRRRGPGARRARSTSTRRSRACSAARSAGVTPRTSAELATLILEQAEVAVVPGEAFGPSGYLRLSYALSDDDLVEGVTPDPVAAGRGRVTAVPHAVEVAGLRKLYGEKRAVDGLDLHVAHGEVVAILGPNGAGKTTTVEILEGYRSRDGGDVRVLGRDPQDGDRAWRSRLGIVLQSNNDLAEATVAELVRHFARFFPDPRDPDEVIASVGLQEKVRTRARQLSGGQRRRLDVALGIVGRPELLFLDEPTTGFDPQARRSFWDLVERSRPTARRSC